MSIDGRWREESSMLSRSAWVKVRKGEGKEKRTADFPIQIPEFEVVVSEVNG